jgi:hypothetical protein
MAASQRPQKRATKVTKPRKPKAVRASRLLFRVPRSEVATSKDVDAIRKLLKLKTKRKLEECRRIIRDCIIDGDDTPDARISFAIQESDELLRGYTTLDDKHRSDIESLLEKIGTYLRDATRKRPLNALMLAAPGAGKSHFIKQLAAKMAAERVDAVTFNMATMQSADDMAQPIDELRNLKVNDRFPLLFLDEFDSDPSRYPALLPLLWDGELHVGHRDLKLGKAVIVLAGSNPDLPKTMDRSAQMKVDADGKDPVLPGGKLIDLLSRVNGGVIEIPDLDLRTEHRDRRVDKVCVAVSLLKARFGKKTSEIPRSLLRFIGQTTFRYGVRSIAHLIDVIHGDAFKSRPFKAKAFGLPLSTETDLQNSSLKLHFVDKDQGFGIVNRWKECADDNAIVRIERRRDWYWWQLSDE